MNKNQKNNQPNLANDNDESVDQLTRLIEKNKKEPLTSQQLNSLIYQARQGNIRARNKILLANQGLIYFFAKPYTNRGISLEDLVMEGNIGLIRAVDKFDPEVGVKFSSYAKWWIKDSLNRARANFGEQVRVPKRANRVNKTTQKEPASISKGIEEKPVTSYLKSNNKSAASSTKKLTRKRRSKSNLNSKELSFQSYETMPLESDSPSPYQLIKSLHSKRLVRDLFAELTTKERLILSNEFELNSRAKLTQLEISKYLRIKPATHLQIKRRILHKLKLILAVKGVRSYSDLV